MLNITNKLLIITWSLKYKGIHDKINDFEFDRQKQCIIKIGINMT